MHIEANLTSIEYITTRQDACVKKTMQIKPFLWKCAVGILSIASTIVLGGQSSQAQVSNYYCGSSEGLPTTIYQLSGQEEIPLIRWKTTLGEQWTPRVRCEEVSQRFERFEQENTLEFLTTGRVNNMPVVCAVSQEGEECSDRYNSDRVLFTLPIGRNPNKALEELLGFASVVENFAPAEESFGSTINNLVLKTLDPRSYYNGRTYININKWIRRNRRMSK